MRVSGRRSLLAWFDTPDWIEFSIFGVDENDLGIWLQDILVGLLID